ncbi:mucin-2 [Lutzomyia longipalpis]|uniref:mucin-2 n=1 Tax=Lutzomyia longipalpis TaxID=7200 RepID=UPI00248336E5|nr:mucin-2 [Lutzomyia longipalpis]
MDTVYSTKKYLQTLTAGSDYYRSPSTVRQMSHDYTSYHNTMGRRSTLNPYTHMTNKYSYPTDHSLSSHYGGYNSWGLWRDSANLSLSALSSTKKRGVRSFSIILMTAAFIVVLAVLSVAGLAFYFSTFRSEMDDSLLVFDGSFQVMRGDLYTTGLKYNHTAAFRQKQQFYERLIDSALASGGLRTTRCDVMSFGSGPLVNVNFRVFVDIKSTPPMTMINVEEHIRNSLLNEVTSSNSSFKNIKIDPESIEVKRSLDVEALKTSSFVKEIDMATETTTRVTPSFDERITKKSGVIEKTIHKFSSSTTRQTQSPKPTNSTPSVIQGSYEITKTEADLTYRKDYSTPTVATTDSVTTVTLKPFVNHATIKVKSPSKKGGAISTVEKINATRIHNVGKVDKVENPVRTTTFLPVTVTPVTSTESLMSTSTKEEIISEAQSSTSSSTTESVSQSSTEEANENVSPSVANNKNPPKLDVNLFTSSPVLDHEPWRPINPSTPPRVKPVEEAPIAPKIDVTQPKREEVVLYRNRGDILATEKSPPLPIYYQSYTNPSFSATTMGIERLGAADVKPYPLPVNKLYDDDVNPTSLNQGEVIRNPTSGLKVTYDDYIHGDRFEHLGGGVIVKKPETASQENNSSAEVEVSTVENIEGTTPPMDGVEEADQLGEILYDLLNTSDEKYATTDGVSTTEKINFNNIRQHILNMARNTTSNPHNSTTTENSFTASESARGNVTSDVITLGDISSESVTTSSYVEVETLDYTPPSWDPPALFPIQSKWEFVNGSSVLVTENIPMKRIYNDTLQAWIVENSQQEQEPTRLQELTSKKQDSGNIQNISAIFDTLASKLGITPNIASKIPPFHTSKKNRTRGPSSTTESLTKETTTVSLTTPRSTSPATKSTTTTTETTSSTDATDATSEIPLILVRSSSETTPNLSAETISGMAEVEEVDPAIFEEIMRRSSTTKLPPLVTLLPARSNLAVRTFRPPIKHVDSRNFKTPLARIVTASMSVGN